MNNYVYALIVLPFSLFSAPLGVSYPVSLDNGSVCVYLAFILRSLDLNRRRLVLVMINYLNYRAVS